MKYLRRFALLCNVRYTRIIDMLQLSWKIILIFLLMGAIYLFYYFSFAVLRKIYEFI